MRWPGRAQRPRTTVEQDGEASKLKEFTMHTHKQSPDRAATNDADVVMLVTAVADGMHAVLVQRADMLEGFPMGSVE